MLQVIQLLPPFDISDDNRPHSWNSICCSAGIDVKNLFLCGSWGISAAHRKTLEDELYNEHSWLQVTGNKPRGLKHLYLKLE
ncbi:hypothetical protein FOLKNPGA_01184 [Legionella sp. PC1000]|uniref:hypothetical protein n=1 Tax=Legionella sp. PC1000 TaxID=2746060 RepID=UPI0015FB9578|nr:hypothetical protein [Legionella sp. PC1000]QLZ68406.1 hypothetical protein FOLKNPGA_01184 [Legionella sp. PC1000]